MKPVLLVVEDDSDVAELFRTLLRRRFEVHVAQEAVQAEQILREHAVTHLVVDAHVGGRGPLGPALIERWRAERPSIRLAALFTGDVRVGAQSYPGVDAVFAKPKGFEPLLALLVKSAA